MFWGTPLTFVNARVVAPGGRLARTLRVRRGRIDGVDVAPDRDDTVVDAGGACVFPGLVNAHDHLELNAQPRLKWRDRYDNVREWIDDFQPRFDSPELAVNRPETLDDRVWIGGLKNLLAGTTTVCHHNPLHPVLRRAFPVRVVRAYGFSHSLQIDGARVPLSFRQTPAAWPWLIHAAEGVDGEARREIETLRASGCLAANTVIVHGVGLDEAGRDAMLAAGAGLVWCPSSNAFLFGATADVRAFDDADRLALGSDSRLSGEGDLLDELRAAYATRQLSPQGLSRIVTEGAGRLLRLPSAGRLVPGAPADLVVLQAAAADPFEVLVSASRRDVRLTMIGGAPQVAVPELAPVFRATRTACEPARLDGAPRLVARWLARRVARLRLQEPGFEVGR
ncbi:MAG: amidohydrolase family protein [Acidobacteriota bacterium]